MKAATERSAWNGVAIVSVLGLSSTLLAHAYVGSFGRPLSDDYCMASIFRSHGFLGAQRVWYEQWSGRFSYVMVTDLANLIGPKIIPFLPATVLSSWLAALTWAIFSAVGDSFRIGRTVLSLLLAETIIVGTLATTASLYQSLYWQTGVITYVMPLVFGTTYFGLLGRIAMTGQTPGRGLALLGGTLTFVAAGFSESFAVLQLVGLILALFLSVALRPQGLLSKECQVFLLIGLIGAILGAALLVIAPGNDARMAEASAVGLLSPPSRSWFIWVKTSARFGLDSMMIACRPWRFVAMAACFPAVLAFTLTGKSESPSPNSIHVTESAKCMAFGAIIALGLIACSFVPAAYVVSYLQANYQPPERLFVIPQFVFYCFVCLESYWMGIAARAIHLRPTYRFRLFVVGSFATLIIAGGSARTISAMSPTARNFAIAWDRQDEKIRAARTAGLRTVQVEGLPATTYNQRARRYFGLRLMDSASDNWVNQCAAEYYGLDFIVAE